MSEPEQCQICGCTEKLLTEGDCCLCEECNQKEADSLEKISSLESENLALKEERDEAIGYTSRLFKILAPQCTPQHTVMGLILQLDNYIAGQSKKLELAEKVVEVAISMNHANYYPSLTEALSAIATEAQPTKDDVKGEDL